MRGAWLLLLQLALCASQNPLFISQYLPNNAATARKLSTVQGIGNATSYSGYITVDKDYFSNMFFWFFPAQNGDPKAPVLLWLQGGPGASSLFGLFGENGPFSVSADGKTLIPRQYSWNNKYAMLYIDNPVGVGFSFTQSERGFSSDEDHVASNLYSAMTQFFQVYTDYAANDFYVTGESYAGKYVPSLAYKIHQMNQKSAQKINLKGIAIGDGALDPITQFTGYSDLMFYLGMADENQVEVIKKYERQIVESLGSGELVKAFRVFDEMMNGDFYPYPTYFTNITGSTNYFNVLSPVYPPNPYPQYLNTIRNSIHVGNYPYFDYNATVELHLIADWMRSVGHILPTLMDHYKVLIYNGQLDLILGPPATERFLETVEWKGAKEYEHVKREIWRVNGQVAGYARSVGEFRQVIVLAAGHMVPADQPQNAYDMMDRFIHNKPFGQ